MVSIHDLEGNYSVASFGDSTDYGGVQLHFNKPEGNTINFGTRVANSMQGTLNLKDDKLTGVLISTMMMGPDHLMALETFLNVGSNKGLAVATTPTGLSLEYDGTTLLLKKE